MKRLFVGGPLDGQWIDTEGNWNWVHQEPQDYDENPTPAQIFMNRTTYTAKSFTDGMSEHVVFTPLGHHNTMAKLINNYTKS